MAKNNHTTIMLVGSRTGGPLIPLLGIRDELLLYNKNFQFFIVGIKGGFEETIAEEENIPIAFLPEIKRNTNTPNRKNIFISLLSTIANIIKDFFAIFFLFYSIFKSIFIIYRIQPALIVSMSNFLFVPITYAAYILNYFSMISGKIKYFFGKKQEKKILLALHQMDIENLTSKLTAQFVDLYTAGFKEIANKSKIKCIFVPNPIRFQKFNSISPQKAFENLSEVNLFNPNNPKPLFLIFGGGSGSKFINEWTRENLEVLMQHFQILHLTGYLQKEEENSYPISKNDYHHTPGLNNLMPSALIAANIILSRAGMSTISELLYLKKRAFLVPIPNSHQEKNAEMVKEYFTILSQNQKETWIDNVVSAEKYNLEMHSIQPNSYYTDCNRNLYRDLLLKLLEK